MKRTFLGLALLLAGCHQDPRADALAQGARAVHDLLLRPELKALASRQKGNPAQQRVEALFSDEARALWPPRQEEETTYRVGDGTLPGRIAYLRDTDAPWSVVVRPSADGQAVFVDGYGVELNRPSLHDEVRL